MVLGDFICFLKIVKIVSLLLVFRDICTLTPKGHYKKLCGTSFYYEFVPGQYVH